MDAAQGFEAPEGDPEAEMDVMEPRDDDSQARLDLREGRTAVVVPGEDLSPDDHAGWTLQSRKHYRGREEGSQPLVSTGKPAATALKSQPTRAQFARKVNATMARMARMPRSIPREDYKIVVRPRGGLQVGRARAADIMRAVVTAVGFEMAAARSDTVCPNPAQNILVISTPDESRARAYAQMRSVTLNGQEHEVYAYNAAPDDTAKGVIRNISAEDSPEEIRANIVNEFNPLAIDAHRIGKSTTIIVLFQGNRVPSTVKYGLVLTRCSLYRQHHEVCRTCGQVGHRRDVCPRPQTRVCFACGKSNPSETHGEECRPKCKLCGGPHPTGASRCKNRFKTPYLVKKRQWERKCATPAHGQTLQQGEQFGERNFPPLLHQPRDSSRGGGGRSQRHASRSASAGKRGKSADSVSWAAAVAGAPASRRGRSKTPQRKREASRQRDDAMERLRQENASLKAKMSRMEDTIQRLIAQSERPRREPPTTTVPEARRDRPREPTTPAPRAVPEHRSPRPEDAPRPAQQSARVNKAATPRPNPPTMTGGRDRSHSEVEEEFLEESLEVSDNENRHREGVSVAVRLRRTTERIDRLEKRVDAMEHRLSARITAIERRLDALQEFLYEKLGGSGKAAHDNYSPSHADAPTWPDRSPSQD